VEKVKKGYKMSNGKTYKVHLDGFNLLPFLSGKEKESPRKAFLYWSDDGECMALRVGRFKIVFAEQRKTGVEVWREPLAEMRIPKFFDLRADPFERGEESFKYYDWFAEQNFLMYSSVPAIAHWLESFREFPPRCKPASFSIDRIMEKMLPKDGAAQPAQKAKPEIVPEH
jgi:arylsulfatase